MLPLVRITRKLIVAFAGLIVAFALTAYSVVASVSASDRATAALRANVAATSAARALFASFVAEQNEVRGYVIGQLDAMLHNIADMHEQYATTLATMRAAEPDPEIQATVTEADRLFREWRSKSAERQITLARDPATRAQASAFISGAYAGRIRAAIDKVIAAESDLIKRHSAMQEEASAAVGRTLMLAGIGMAPLAAAMCWLLTRAIARPTRAMAAAMRQLADGDVDAFIPAETHRDELGEMAAAIRNFRGAELERRRLERETAAIRSQVEAERAKAAAEATGHIAAQAGVVRNLGARLSALTKGDLTIRIGERFTPRYEQLRSNFDADSDEQADMADCEPGRALGVQTPLRALLVAHRGVDLDVDASGVGRLGGLCLQLLVAARLTWEAGGKDFVAINISEPCRDALRLAQAGMVLGVDA